METGGLEGARVSLASLLRVSALSQLAGAAGINRAACGRMAGGGPIHCSQAQLSPELNFIR